MAKEAPKTETKIDQKPNAIAKITAKELGFGKKVLEELCITNKDKTIPIIRIVGMASAAEPKESENPDMEDSILFRGMFKATNIFTGAVYTSSKLYVPSVIQDTLGALFLQNSSDSQTVVRCMFDITVTRSQKEKGSAYVFGWINHSKDVDNLFTALDAELPPVPEIKALGIIA